MPTNPSIPISFLNDHLYVTKDDFVPVVDSSSLTTYKSKIETLDKYFSTSGSSLVVYFTSRSISSSYSVDTNTASYVYPVSYFMTASWTQNVVWSTVVQTASLAYNSNTSSRLQGIGNSYENVFVVNTIAATTGSGYIAIVSKNNLTSSTSLPAVKANSVFFNKDYTPGTNGYGKLFFFEDNQTNTGKLVLEIGDEFSVVNGIGPDIETIARTNAGILFQTSEAGNLNGFNRTGSLLFIKPYDGRTYARIIEAQEFSSSITSIPTVGFYGTASYAINCSTSLVSAQTFPVGCIVGMARGTSSIATWATCSGEIYSTASYSALGLLTGKGFGETMSIATYSKPRDTIAPTALGEFTITASAGGSGLFKLIWNGTDIYFINGRTSNFVKISGLTDGTYTYNITDYGFTPTESINFTAKIGLNGPDTGSTFVTGSSNYRYPNMSQNTFVPTSSYFYTTSSLSPLTWMIQTG